MCFNKMRKKVNVIELISIHLSHYYESTLFLHAVMFVYTFSFTLT